MDPRKLHSTEEIAKACGVTRSQVWRWRAAGHLPRGYQLLPNTPWMVDERELQTIRVWARTRPRGGRPRKKAAARR